MIKRVQERDIAVELTDAARTLLGNLGYDPTYGARPLKRVIQKRLVDPLALAILEGRFVAGDTVLRGRSRRRGRARARRAARTRPGGIARVPLRRVSVVEVSGGPNETRRTAVPTYIMLSTLTPEGVQTVKNNPSRIREVNREVEQLGATVKAQWATLGQFDFVNVVEAPDEQTMARVSLELGSRGTARYETLVAIPVDDFIGSI